MIRLRNVIFLLTLILSCCKKPFNPPATSTSVSYLVVEGVINTGADSTVIRLSRTVNVNAKTTVNPVLGASVTVESNQNLAWPLTGDSAGNYKSAGSLNLSASAMYRLRIKTTEGQQYLSDFVPVKPTPAIDSVGYSLLGDGAHLYVNAHDATNNTHYYHWDYEETWVFHSMYVSDYVADPVQRTIVPRNINSSVYYCFGNDRSSNVLINSTAYLTQDQVFQNLLVVIPYTSEKFEMKYSILVKQYALTGDAYRFYFLLKKNTEQLGSIFDALPTALTGNIHNLSGGGLPVIGFITATNIQTKRIFITDDQLPPALPIYPYQCRVDTATGTQIDNILIDTPLTDIPIELTIKGYSYSTPICVDCTLRGTTKIPSFWK